MSTTTARRSFYLSMLLLNVAIVVLAILNISALRESAQLPPEYRTPYMLMQYQSETVAEARMLTSFDGQDIHSPMHLDYLLTMYRHGSSIPVTDVYQGEVTERRITLVPATTSFSIGSSLSVGTIFLLFALYVLFRHRDRSYAPVLHLLAACTAIMILFDWGALAPLPLVANFLLRLLFDLSIWILPTLFFHFSFIYPTDRPRLRRRWLVPWYAVSLIGMGLSIYYTVTLYVGGTPILDTDYLPVHGIINDVFLIAGLLCTVAHFEYAALKITDAVLRKNVYWVLLGIMFGPLVYVFMILAPRILQGSEFVSDALMQYTLILAPLMFWKVLRRERQPE